VLNSNTIYNNGTNVGIGTAVPTATALLTINPTTNALRNGIDMTLSGATSTATGLNITTGNLNVNGISVTHSSASLTSSLYGIGSVLSSTNIVSGYNGFRNGSGLSYGIYGINGTSATYATNANTWAAFLQGRTVISSETSPSSALGTDLEIRNTTTGAGNPTTVSLRQTVSNTTNATVLSNLNFGDNHQTGPQAQIQVIRGAAGGAGDLPTDMIFSTTPDASLTLTERMRIMNSGNIGIGTAAPQTLLHLTRPSGGNGNLIVEGNSSVTGAPKMYLIDVTGATVTTAPSWMISNTVDKMAISRAPTLGGVYADFINIDNTGNVGIGTAVPGYKLEINGSAKGSAFIVAEGVSGTGVYNQYINVRGDASTDSYSFINFRDNRLSINNMGNGGVQLRTGAGIVLVADNAGHVGIGTATPSGVLHTIATGAKTTAYSGSLLTNTATSATNAIIKAGLEVTSTGNWTGVASSNMGLYVSSVTGGTNNYDAVFNGGGNVGIGTISPSTQLHTTGGVRFQTLTGTGNRFVVADLNGNLSAASATTSGIVTGSGTLNYIPKWTPDGATLGNSSIFDNGTNVGIGTSVFGANGLLQVAGDVGLSGVRTIRPASNADTDFLRYLGTQLVIGSANSAAYGYAGGGLIAAKSNGDGVILFDAGRITGSAALLISNTTTSEISLNLRNNAGTSVLFSSTNTGNVGIGTTSPTAKLHISQATGSALKFDNRQLIIFNQNTNPDTTGNIIGGMGFYGFGVTHGQFHYRAGKGFEMIDVSPDAPNIAHASTTFAPLYLSSLYTTGNVGIGTSNPTIKLSLIGATNGESVGFEPYTYFNSAYSSANASISHMVKTNVGVVGYNKSTGITTSSSLIEVGDAITFATKASDANAAGTAWDLATNTKMIITNTGNVGIGTASPSSKLVVDNNTSADASLVLQNSISDGSNIRFQNSGTNAFSIDQIEAPNARLRIFTESGPSGNVERLTILESGNIGIGTTTPTSTLDVNGTISGNYQGFSYYAVGAAAPGGWNDVIIPTLDYNTFGGGSYNTGTGTFTAPKTGYYRFMLGGWMSANTAINDRYAIGIAVNGTLRAFGGGQFSSGDSPEGSFTHVVRLNAGDIVQPRIFNSIAAISLGAASAGHQFWFQGEFVGK